MGEIEDEIEEIKRRSGIPTPWLWRTIRAGVSKVRIYWAVAFLIAVAAFGLQLVIGETWPVAFGGFLIGVVTGVFQAKCGAADGVLQLTATFVDRLLPMNLQHTGVTSIKSFLGKVKQRGRPFEFIVLVTEVVFLALAALLAIAGELRWHR